jgi:hypothetical protein
MPIGDEGYLGAALGEHTDTRSRVVVSLAYAAYRDAVVGRERATAEADHYRDLYNSELRKVAVLEEREGGRGRLHRISYLGTLLAGVGGSWAVKDGSVWSVGTLLLLVGVVVFFLASPLSRRSS